MRLGVEGGFRRLGLGCLVLPRPSVLVCRVYVCVVVRSRSKGSLFSGPLSFRAPPKNKERLTSQRPMLNLLLNPPTPQVTTLSFIGDPAPSLSSPSPRKGEPPRRFPISDRRLLAAPLKRKFFGNQGQLLPP